MGVKATLQDQQLISKAQAKDNAGVLGIPDNGVYHLYTSPKQITSSLDNALEVVIKYAENLPNPALGQLARYNLIAVIETEDDDGSWHPIHAQFSPYVNPDDGGIFVIKLDPAIFVIDNGVTNDISNGFSIISRECVKQGTLPDDFRICILVNDYSFQNGVSNGGFEEVKLTVTYNTYRV